MKTRLADPGRAGPLGPPGIKDSDDPTGHTGAPSGRALPRRKLLPHGIPSWVNEGAIFFVTICCVMRDENQLCEQKVAALLFEAVEFRQSRGDWYMHLLVLMPDHLHILVLLQRDLDMKKVISNFKEMTSKKAHISWQPNFFDHRLRSGESFDEKAFYMRMNPVRNGLVAYPENWPYIWPTTNTARPAVAPYLP